MCNDARYSLLRLYRPQPSFFCKTERYCIERYWERFFDAYCKCKLVCAARAQTLGAFVSEVRNLECAPFYGLAGEQETSLETPKKRELSGQSGLGSSASCRPVGPSRITSGPTRKPNVLYLSHLPLKGHQVSFDVIILAKFSDFHHSFSGM